LYALSVNLHANLSLLTDFYQLTMAYAYWKAGLDKRKACFHLFFRRPPFHGGFTIASGLESVIQYIEKFSLDKDDISYLDSLTTPAGERYFEKDFLDMLSKLKLHLTIDAVPEATTVFPFEPLLRVQGPLMQCQLLESPLLNLINFPTLIATKAARVCLAAQGDAVLEFGMRRAQGIDGALTASRAAFVGGCTSTSNVLAGKLFGIPVQGTLAHSWIMAFDDEEESFKAYAKIMPDSVVFLVDTYDTLDGVKKAIRVGKWLKTQGKEMLGIRLDSGDLAQLSIESRKLLDEAGFQETKILASNELDETVISELKRQGSKVQIWGVGTNLVTGGNQAALDGVYKLSALQDDTGKWKYTLKLSEQLAKVSNPGLQQIRRYYKDGYVFADVIYDTELGISERVEAIDPFDPSKSFVLDDGLEYSDLLKPIFADGKLVFTAPSLQELQAKTSQELKKLPVGMKRFLNPQIYPVYMEKGLYELKLKLIRKIRKTRSSS
jgi:nicotinate phosphoribosyltransferase